MAEENGEELKRKILKRSLTKQLKINEERFPQEWQE